LRRVAPGAARNHERFDEASDERMGAVRTIGELFHFLIQRRAWFLIPIVAGLLLIGCLLILASATPLGPFIYTIF
jgi:hypothetical protein